VGVTFRGNLLILGDIVQGCYEEAEPGPGDMRWSVSGKGSMYLRGPGRTVERGGGGEFLKNRSKCRFRLTSLNDTLRKKRRIGGEAFGR